MTRKASFIGAAFAAILSYPSRAMANVDPFDNVGRAFSHARRAVHRYGDKALLVFAIVALHVLPATAMPVFSAKHGVFLYGVAAKTGLLGAFAVGATAAPAKMPFRYGTVRRRINIGNYPVALGGAIPTIIIPQVGMLARIVVNITGTYTKANATGLNQLDGYDAIVSRAKVSANNGAASIVDLSGIGIRAMNKSLRPSLPIKRGLLTTAGAQTFNYKFILPVNANQRRQFEMGLINLQAPEIRVSLDISFNQLASIFATAADVTNFLATANVSYEYYEIPDLSRYALPPMTLVRTLEDAPVAIAAVGDQIYQIPRQGTMIDYHAVLVLNNVYGTVLNSLTEFRWRYNISDTQYDVFIPDWETYEAELYGDGSGLTFLDTAMLSFNLWAAGDRDWNGGDFRDAIDTEENTTTQSIITVAAAQALNAGKDNIYHVRRVVQRIVQAPAPSAA